jgi:hypothetical protein
MVSSSAEANIDPCSPTRIQGLVLSLAMPISTMSVLFHGFQTHQTIIHAIVSRRRQDWEEGLDVVGRLVLRHEVVSNRNIASLVRATLTHGFRKPSSASAAKIGKRD